MRHLILWIVAILITFSIGVATDQVVQQLSAVELTASVPLEPVALDSPVVKAEPVPPTVAESTPAAPPKPIFILDYDREKFWPWAVFQAMEPVSKEFAEVDSIEVGINGNADSEPGYIAVYSSIDNNNDSAQAVFALVTERRLFFVTGQMRNSEFEYRFDGEFLHTDFERLGGKNKAVLRGTLTKMKHGRTIAQRTLSFRVEHLGC
jgi:hypothetical protein